MENVVVIPEAVIEAAARMLSAFIPGITAGSLREMLNADKGEKENLAARKEYTRKEAAARLGVVTRTVDRMIYTGKLDARRIGAKKILITRESVDALLDVKKYAPAAGQL